MAGSLPLHGALPEPSSRPALALSAKGFRVFFMLAAAFAAAIVPLWLLILRGVVPARAYVDPITWHAHELIFGFVVAVLAGFLLTAISNWTQRETLVGAPLLGLSGLWLSGRIAMMFGHALPRELTAVIDLAFLPALMFVLARPLFASNNRRNWVMLVLLAALFAANVVVHLEALGRIAAGSGRRACMVALDVVLLFIAIIAGRVFPMFTRNATRVSTIRSIAWLDLASIIGMALLAVLDALAAQPATLALVAGVTAALSAARAWHWGAQHSLRQPLLWILHAGYAWLVIGLGLRAAAVPGVLATHALTVGAIGSLTLGMMARVALGHTGRPLVLPTAMAWAFVAMSGAACVRVFGPWLFPAWYFAALVVSAALWTLAFSIFVVVYAPILAAPRVDGKAG